MDKTVKKTIDKKEKPDVKFVGKYYYAVGRRKSSSATVRLYPKGTGQILINDKNFTDHFSTEIHQNRLLAPLNKTSLNGKCDISVKVSGGGISGQADAIRLAIARALILWQIELRPVLKAEGFLKRDARIKERKKPGLKRARRAPQWQKR